MCDTIYSFNVSFILYSSQNFILAWSIVYKIRVIDFVKVTVMKANSSQAASRPKLPSRFAEELRKKYAKQQQRKIPTGSLPTATLDIPLDFYVSFVEHLKSSTRILALFGAGLSAASGVPTFRGAGGFWREHDATELATPEAFNRDPSFAWQFYNHRRHLALKAKPNRAHVAFAKLADKKPEFLAITQNIDSKRTIRSKLKPC